MNTLMILRKRTPVALRMQTINPRHVVDRYVARAAQHYWWLRKAGEPLCDVNVSDVHVTLFVPPQQVALETILRNEAALARYCAVRYVYRTRRLTYNFHNLVLSPVDHIAGQPRRTSPTIAHVKLHTVKPVRLEAAKIAANGT